MQALRLYAHRGAAAERPENTMAAFERAVGLGDERLTIALEMDVHLTRDGHLIVAHDDTARRMAAVDAPWHVLDLADVRRLDVGWGFVAPDGTRPFAGCGIGVPTLEEVIAAFPRTRLNVDIKRGGRAAEVMLELVRRTKAEDRVTIASFHTGPLIAIRRRGYGGETSLARGELATLLSMPAVLSRQLPFTGTAAQVPVSQGALRFDRAPFIAKCHSLGLRVDFWTIDDPAEAERLLKLGADGIITNDPAALRPLFS